jgi:polysaccharide biosynthesis transport protein
MADIVPSSPIVTNLEPYAPPAPREVTPAGQVNALSLFKAFRARWIWALLIGTVLGGGAAAAAFYSNPARYYATAQVRVLSSKAGVFDHGQIQETDKSPFQRAQPSLVTSRGVLRAAATTDRGHAIAATGRYGDLTVWLERNIKVGYIEDTDVMQFSLAGFDAKETADLLNLVVSAYTDEAIRTERNQLNEQIETLNNAAIALQETIRREKDNLQALAKTLKTADPKALSVQQTLRIEEHARARSELAATRAQIRDLEVNIATFRAMAAAPVADQPPSYLIEQQVETDPVVMKQAANVRDKQDILLRAQNNGLPGNPALKRFETGVKVAKEGLESARAEARQRVSGLVQNRTRGEAAVEVKRLEESLRIRKGQLQGEIEEEEKLRHELDRLGTSSFELEAKRAEVDEKQATLKIVSEKRAQLQVEAQSNRMRIERQQLAEPPDSKNTRSRDTLTALAGFAGLFIGVLGTSFLEFRTRRIQSADDVTGELGMNVVGTLPVLPNRWSSNTGTGDGYWGHLVTESVAYIRTVVLADRGPKPTRVLMITSAQAQEGKTMLASNLALSIARTGRRTLLLDGDLRRPSVAPLFGVPEGPGVAEILRGEAVAAECIRPSAMPGLSLLPAGRCCRQVIQELARGGIENLFRQLREEFDFIVVDSSPVLPVSDSLLLGRLVDAVVFCVRPKVSRAPSVYAAHEMLSRVNIPVLGTVINGARRHSGSGADYLYLIGENGKTPAEATATSSVPGGE